MLVNAIISKATVHTAYTILIAVMANNICEILIVYLVHLLILVTCTNACTAQLRAWMTADKLLLNDSKTNFILVGTCQELLEVLFDAFAVGSYHVLPGIRGCDSTQNLQ